jgi:hypothetical protein
VNYTVSFSAGALIKGMGLQIDSAIKQALANTATTTQAAWQQSVLQTRGLWQPIKDRYAASVKLEINADGYSARIYSDDPMATPIETGIPARDMKGVLDTSLKVRTAMGGKHAGQRYLIIPFRHNTPGNDALAGAMPAAIYARAKTLAKSTVTGQISMRAGIQYSNIRTKGQQMVMRNTYKWGGRLDGPDIAKRFKGMVRFNTSSGDQKSSSYLTFRVMGEWSTGWIIPAQPGRYIVKAVSEQAQQMLRSEVQDVIASAS